MPILSSWKTTFSILKEMMMDACHFYKDLYHYIFCRLIRENYVGRYIHIMRKRQRYALFDGKIICGGATFGLPSIDIFADETCVADSAEAIIEVINHEVIHQVLLTRIGIKLLYLRDLDMSK